MLVLSGPAGARTWTSATGNTVDAEFVRLEGQRVVLKTADGRTLGIPASQLSAADQEFVKGQAAASAFLEAESGNDGGPMVDIPPPEVGLAEPVPDKPAAVPAAPVAAPAAPAAAPAPKGPPAKGFFQQAYEKAAPMNSDDLGGFEVKAPGNIAYLAVQTGPAAGDLHVLVLDGGSSEVGEHDVMHWYDVKKGLEKPLSLDASRTRFPRKDGERVHRFRPPPFTTQFGDIKVTHEWEVYDGVKQPGLVYLVAELTMQKGATSNVLVLCGFINARMSLGAGELVPYAYLQNPVYQIRQRYSRVYGSLKVGEFWPVPKSGMEKSVELIAFQKDGRQVDRIKVPLDDEIIEIVEAQFRFAEPFKRTKAGQVYQVKSVADMGLLGALEATCTYKAEDD